MTLEKHWSDVLQQRKETIVSIDNHEQLLAKHQEHIEVVFDPWLSERLLFRQLRAMTESENLFQENIQRVETDIMEFERSLLEEAKQLMSDYLMARSAQYAALQVHVND
jgi:hypothetical protein